MPLLELEAAGRTYSGPPAVEALRSATLSIRSGEYCAITGPSGAGKSTLLNVIGLLDRLDSGAYRIDGRDAGELSRSETDTLRGSVFGFVFQSAHMVGQWTVAANVSLGLRAQHTARATRRRAVADALDLVGMSHRANARADQLSGGERQRAAIARAVCARPGVLLADEPTGNLDSRNAAAVLALFDVINASGVTVVVITHDEQVAARAGRRLVVHDGAVQQ